MAALPRTSPDKTLAKAVQDHKAGRIVKALKGYRRVLKRNPVQYDALVLGGQAAFHCGNNKEALRLLKRASDKYPNDPNTSYNLGVLHQATHNIQEALSAFRKAVQAGPDFAPAQYNLAVTLLETGEEEESLIHFDRAIAAEPHYAEAFSSKAFVLRKLGKFEDAINAYRRAVHFSPGDAKAWSGLGIALQENCDLEDALAAHRNAVSADPDYPDATGNLSDTLVQMNQPMAALDACDAYLARHPADAGVLATKSIALNEAGENDKLEELVDLDRLVRPIKQDVPSGFKDLDSFNQALGDHIVRHPTLITSPSSHATKKGKHTGTINAGDKGPIRPFEDLIRSAIEIYMEAFSDLDTHPISTHRPEKYDLSVWAVVLEGEGYQLPHIHPSAWLSGVYYVRVPKVANEGGHHGWIEFGQPGPEYHFSAEPTLRLIKPEPGLMVMFPSYMFHRTVPFESDETRISIAFDVVPA